MIIRSYLIVILAVLIFLFLVGCVKSNDTNQNFNSTPNKKEIIKSELETVRDDLLSLHNQERSKRKLENFEIDMNLCDYAQKHAEYMFSKNKLVHSDISDVGSKAVAENIAYGQEDAKEVTEAWMNSYFHKLNILNKKYKKIGFGYVNKDGKIYWCAVFTN